MNYELALALKKAGFPSADWGKYYDCNKVIIPVPKKLNFDGSITVEVSDSYLHDGLVPQGDDVYYVPTLSELIEACGERFFRLSHSKNNDGTSWDAESWEVGEIETGKNPEEAVANLWLATNKKL